MGQAQFGLAKVKKQRLLLMGHLQPSNRKGGNSANENYHVNLVDQAQFIVKHCTQIERRVQSYLYIKQWDTGGIY